MDNAGLKRFDTDNGLSKDLHILDECCKDISEGSEIHVYLEEGRFVDGKITNEVTLGEKSVMKDFAHTELFFNVTNRFATIVITFKNKVSTEKSAIYNLYEIYKRKADEFFKKNEDKIAHLSFYFVKQDEINGVATTIDCHNPVLITKSDEDGTLTILADLEAFHYGVQLLDYNQMDEEIENDIAEEVNIEVREERKRQENEEQLEFANQFIGVSNDDDNF